MGVTIHAHSVKTHESGLSYMQERIIRSPKFVRLVAAPTGSGKSYAFVHEVLNHAKSVLFIVPTKRLLQNLILDARNQARSKLQEKGISDDSEIERQLSEQIIEWSGNQFIPKNSHPSAHRSRQLHNPGMYEFGRIIFAIPEVVLNMISGLRVTGASTINPFFYMRDFDYVVFDEFHTIDDKYFGLACMFSRLAIEEKKCKISLLSATPIDITNLLQKLDVPLGEIELIHEEIVDHHQPDCRPIHGNVEINLCDCSLAEAFGSNIDIVQKSLRNKFTVILIYDSLERLESEYGRISSVLDKENLAHVSIKKITSIEDSKREPGENYRTHTDDNPSDFDVLVCTSSVEQGVTFRSDLMFLEPGFSRENFMQRMGRVARGSYNGSIFVSVSQNSLRRSKWTRDLTDVIQNNDCLTIQDFTNLILNDVKIQLQPLDVELESNLVCDNTTRLNFYRRPCWRGFFWAALFFIAIRRKKMNIQRSAAARLLEISPDIVKFLDAKISEILSVEIVDDNRSRKDQPHKEWVDALLNSALCYRDIEATIEIEEYDGCKYTVSELFLRRSTSVFSRYIVHEEDGKRLIRLNGKLENECARNVRQRSDDNLNLYIRSPIGGRGFNLMIKASDKGTPRLYSRIVSEWRHRFARYIDISTSGTYSEQHTVMRAATAIVERLGKPPIEEDYEDDRESATFA